MDHFFLSLYNHLPSVRLSLERYFKAIWKLPLVGMKVKVENSVNIDILFPETQNAPLKLYKEGECTVNRRDMAQTLLVSLPFSTSNVLRVSAQTEHRSPGRPWSVFSVLLLLLTWLISPVPRCKAPALIWPHCFEDCQLWIPDFGFFL